MVKGVIVGEWKEKEKGKPAVFVDGNAKRDIGGETARVAREGDFVGSCGCGCSCGCDCDCSCGCVRGEQSRVCSFGGGRGE